VNTNPLHSALREMRNLCTSRQSWIFLGVLGLVVGLVGPFGTFEAINLVPRLAYWTAIVLVTALAGTFTASLVEAWLQPILPLFIVVVIAAMVAGPIIALIVAAINVGIFGPVLAVIDVMTLMLYCTLISLAVISASVLLERSPAVPTPVLTSDKAAPLLDRLTLPQRGRLLHIAVSDHYVDVTTEKGTSLVLMRLSDAIRETAPIAGLQVHRSHWVALDAVRRGVRQNGKAMLELENGTLVPVSRTYMAAVKQAGLLA